MKKKTYFGKLTPHQKKKISFCEFNMILAFNPPTPPPPSQFEMKNFFPLDIFIYILGC